MSETSAARRLWTAFEPDPVVVYFAPETRTVYADAGLKGYWMGYFASRAAGFGPVPATVTPPPSCRRDLMAARRS